MYNDYVKLILHSEGMTHSPEFKLGHKLLYEGGEEEKKGGKRGEKKGGRKKADICNG